MRLRCEVFVVEQRCAYLDIDGRDPEAHHLLARAPDEGVLMGCLRLLPPGISGAPARIGRVATASWARSGGVGRRLVQEALARVRRCHGSVPVELSAQAHLERFYASLGFERTSDDYLEDGIPHCDMRRSGP